MTTTPCQSGDAERFFPAKSTTLQEIKAVKAECKPCPLRESCLDWALLHGEQGIWAGTSEKERKKIRHQRHITVTPVHVDIRDDRADVVRALVARGLTVGEIATALHMSPSGASQAVQRAKRGKAS